MTLNWQALRREILFLTLAGMEACFFTPIVLALSNVAARFPPERAAPTFFVLILIAFYLVRLLDALNLKEQVQRDIGFIVLVGWVLLVLRLTLYRNTPWFSFAWLKEMVSHLDDRTLWPKDLSLIVTTIVFWWRGLELAQRPLDVESVGYSFRSGVLVMAMSVGLASYMLNWHPAPLVFVYFFIGLIAVALSRAEEVSTWRAGLVFPFSLGWLLSIVGTAALVILIALGFISVVTGESIVQTLALLGPVWDALSMLLLLILTLVFSLLQPIFQALFGKLIQALSEAGLQLPEGLSGEELFGPMDQSPAGLQNLQQYSKELTVLLIIAGLAVVALMFGRMWRARRQLGDIQTDSVGRSGKKLADRLQEGLQNLAGRFGIFNRWLAANSIRRIYAQMVAGATRRGYPRADSDTPYEYLPVLNESWPGMASQIRTITEAYVRVHYGELPESAEELESIRSAWAEIQRF